MPLNPMVRKTEMKDASGKILLPRTTASMVSEEPDRRWMDNVEKSFLNSMTVHQQSIENLAEIEEDLINLSNNMDDIVPGSEMKQAILEVSDNIDGLKKLVEKESELITLADLGENGLQGIEKISNNMEDVSTLIAHTGTVVKLGEARHDVVEGIRHISDNLDEIKEMMSNIDVLKDLGKGIIRIGGESPDTEYQLTVDESGDVPRIALIDITKTDSGEE